MANRIIGQGWEYTEYQTIPSRVDGLAERPILKYKSTKNSVSV